MELEDDLQEAKPDETKYAPGVVPVKTHIVFLSFGTNIAMKNNAWCGWWPTSDSRGAPQDSDFLSQEDTQMLSAGFIK